MEHGVDPRPRLGEIELPRNMALLSSGDDSGPGWLSRVVDSFGGGDAEGFNAANGQGGAAADP